MQDQVIAPARGEQLRPDRVAAATEAVETAQAGDGFAASGSDRAAPSGPYRVAEVAAALDVHHSTVYRAIESGQLRAMRVGMGRGTLRVPHNALVAYVTAMAERAATYGEHAPVLRVEVA